MRYIGITHYTAGALPELARILDSEPGIDFVQLRLFARDAARPRRGCCPSAAARGVAVIVNQPFEEGALFRRVKGRALPAWAAEIRLHRPGRSSS